VRLNDAERRADEAQRREEKAQREKEEERRQKEEERRQKEEAILFMLRIGGVDKQTIADNLGTSLEEIDEIEARHRL
jgi:septal ring factor EnvC (AmiA/AmiB activator)